MTATELSRKFNDEFELNKWPTTYEVDVETYANVCQYLFENLTKLPIEGIRRVSIAVGKNNGILFKNVELVMKGKK